MATNDPTDRRELLQAAAAALALGPEALTAAPAFRPPEPGPAMTRPRIAQPTPGRPGDFAFLDGHWRIHQQRRREGEDWDVFEGEASCFSILGGICSVEELRIPSRNFSGMGLRLLDMKTQVWKDHWVNAAWGQLGGDGMPGSFEDGAGIFESEETTDGVTWRYRGVWDRITPRSCRWQQGASRDGGRSWTLSWSMDWTRVG